MAQDRASALLQKYDTARGRRIARSLAGQNLPRGEENNELFEKGISLKESN